jgi:hypothetical protein
VSGFGRTNPYPRRYGGGQRAVTIAHGALLDAYADVFDSDDNAQSTIDALIEAKAAGIVWACNKRLENEAYPLTMQSNLPDWEDATRLRPALADTDVERRERLAAKLRGLSDNKPSTVDATIAQLLGDAYEGPPQAMGGHYGPAISYFPGQEPGPPGLEYASTKGIVVVLYDYAAYSPAEIERRKAAVIAYLDLALPGYETWTVNASPLLELDSVDTAKGLNYGGIL